MTDSDPSATLAGAKRIADGLQFACRLPDKKPDFTACGGPAAEAYWEYFHPARVVSLVAALEAVLKLADDWDAEARGIFLEAARTADAGEVGAASALQSSAADLREAISREITGGGLAMTAIRTTYLWCDFLRCDNKPSSPA